MSFHRYVLSVAPPTGTLFSGSFELTTDNIFIRLLEIKRGTYDGSPASLVLFKVDLGPLERAYFEYAITVEKVIMTGDPAQIAPAGPLPAVPTSPMPFGTSNPGLTQNLAHGASSLFSKALNAGDALFRSAVLPGLRRLEAMAGRKTKGQPVDIAAVGPWYIKGPESPFPHSITRTTLTSSGRCETRYTYPTTPGSSMCMDCDNDRHSIRVVMSGSPEGATGAPRISTIALVIPHRGPVAIHVKYVGSLFENVKSHSKPQILTGLEAAAGNANLVTCGVQPCTPDCSEFGPAHMTPAVWKTLLATEDVAAYDGESGHQAWVMHLERSDDDENTTA